MQVFLPAENCRVIAKILDNNRLNKQILEDFQIIMTYYNINDIWNFPKYIKNHHNYLQWSNEENISWLFNNHLFSLIERWKQLKFKYDKYLEIYNLIKKRIKISDKISFPIIKSSIFDKKIYTFKNKEEVINFYKLLLIKKKPEYYKFNDIIGSSIDIYI